MIHNLFFKKTDKAPVQLLRSIFTSNVAFSVDFGILVLLTELFQIHYLISAGIGFFIGTSVSYALSILWVFERRSLRDKRLEYFIFIFIGLMGVGLNELLIWFFTEKLNVYYLISKILSGSSIFFFNFFARRRVLFR